MDSIACKHKNAKSWNSINIEDKSVICLLCPNCAKEYSFSDPHVIEIIRWDVEYSFNWVYGDWDKIRLYPVSIKTYEVKSNCCNKKFRIKPSFMVEGTTLTLEALVFCAFAYEIGELTWRGLVDNFCINQEIIAHSTIYRAVHGLGELFIKYAESMENWNELMNLKESVGKLEMENCNKNENDKPQHSKKQRAIKQNAQERLNKIREFLRYLLIVAQLTEDILKAYIRFMSVIHRFVDVMKNPIIIHIYKLKPHITNTS
jgi:transcriptional regulator NrdR family protein